MKQRRKREHRITNRGRQRTEKGTRIMTKIARTEYYSQIINHGIAKPNKMFKVINKLLKPTNSLICSTVQQCNTFLKFFADKIENIYQCITFVSFCAPPEIQPLNCPLTRFLSFQTVSIDYISKLIITMSSTTCSLDPVPTSVLKECLSSTSPLILNIVNASLTTGIVPQAHVCLRRSSNCLNSLNLIDFLNSN